MNITATENMKTDSYRECEHTHHCQSTHNRHVMLLVQKLKFLMHAHRIRSKPFSGMHVNNAGPQQSRT